MKQLSIVIVNYNTPDLCRQTVDTVLQTAGALEYEILVVDNSSPEHAPFAMDEEHVTVYAGVENHGFGHACNYGACRACGELLLFLNSDTILMPGALEQAVSCLLSHPKAGALGIKTTLEDGSFDHGCKRGFPTPFNSLCYFLGLDRLFPQSRRLGGYRLTWMSPDETGEVDAVSGAFLMMPRAVFEQLGGFDEAFFMYGEDLDLCYRVRQAGYAVVYDAGAQMLHLKGASGLAARSRVVIDCFHDAMKLFYQKHYRSRYPFFVSWLVYLGIGCKRRLTLFLAERARKTANKEDAA